MKNASGKERWYVDSGAEIRGPLPSLTIVQALVAGTMKVSYRVSKDRVNWKAICNEEHFEQLINSLINDMSATLAQFVPETEAESQSQRDGNGNGGGGGDFGNAGDLHKGISQQLADAQKLTELSVESNALRKVLVAIAMQKKTVVHIQNKPADALHPEDASEYIIEGVGESSRWNPWKSPVARAALAVVVIFGAGDLAFKVYKIRKENARVEQIEKIRKEALYSKVMGDYDKALGLFEKIPEKDLDTMDSKTLTEMAEASLQKSHFPESHRFFLKALKASQDPAEKSRIFSFLGLVDMKSGNSESAASQLQSSLDLNPDLYSSLHNLGMVYLNKNSLEPAETLFLKALSTGDKKEASTLLALFEVAMEMEAPMGAASIPKTGAAGTPSYERLTKVDQMLEDYAQHSGDFKAEIALARARIALVKKQSGAAEKWMKLFISLNPSAIPDRDLRADLDNDRVSWQHLYSWCLDIYSAAKTTAYGNAVIAGCLLQTSGAKAALPYSKFAFGLSKDPSVKGLYAYILNATGDAITAQNLLKNDSEDTLSKVSLLTLAKICDQRGDKACAAKYWTKIYVTSPEDPSAASWMADLEYKKGDRRTAQRIIKAGLARNPASKEIHDTAKKLSIE